MSISREEKDFKKRAYFWPYCYDTPMSGPPGCTSKDFAFPKLRKCAFDISTISFIRKVGTGHDGYCWVVKFGETGPFVLKVFRQTKMHYDWGFPPQTECRNAAFLQMIEESVRQGNAEGKPPLLMKNPQTWLDAVDNICAFSTESRNKVEEANKWAAEHNMEVAPVLSVPRLRQCYGWLKIRSKMLEGLPSHVYPHHVYITPKDHWEFEFGNDDKGNDLEYYAIVYEYIEPGENDPDAVQKVLDFLGLAGFADTGDSSGRNWQNSVLLDLSDFINPYERTWDVWGMRQKKPAKDFL